ncbi:Riboflavin biosynthesis protein ribBA [Dermatophilus congolensis]|uniref:Multifunctional fusion protein n=1 Tax=Dermatophilus congolensis TaxID=1863 RepID=A0AA46BMA6_9MICO|nr:3,4-dihydroxy-2-butanone-4-phosphate synthase [Dermatophilus congolensis]STD06673.1 Riboflavin biosynthesis protein ribBA [Dermatophilus congolensis]
MSVSAQSLVNGAAGESVEGLASVEEALEALRAGRPVLVLDDADRENEGDVVLAAATADAAWVAWTVRHSSGYLCAPMTQERADALGLPAMVQDNQDPHGTAYAVTVDAAVGVSTGISAADRALTARLLADPQAGPQDFTRPGHVVPLRARPGGVLVRGGHTEAAVDLCRLAGLPEVGVIGELVHDSGEMMRAEAVLALGREHRLAVITIEDLVAYRQLHDRVRPGSRTVLPTVHGTFDMVGYLDVLTGAEHVALIAPGPGGVGVDAQGVSTVRVHSECLTGDAFGSRRCDCGPQLEASMARIARDGGVVVYLRGHEGRGVGLLSKLEAYALQDEGEDTVDAQTRLGLPIDAREYGAAAAVLADVGVDRVRLLTGNPAKVSALRQAGFDVVESVSVATPVTSENVRYLETKARRMGHDVMGIPEGATSGAGKDM